MPFVKLINPRIPAENVESFLASAGKIAAEMKAQPGVLGVAAGPIVAVNGKPSPEFRYLEVVAFATQEDEDAFVKSEWAQTYKKTLTDLGVELPRHALFRSNDYSPAASKPIVRFSRVTVPDESKVEDVKTSWKELMNAIGKEFWGGRSVEGEEIVGLGVVGFDSVEEAQASFAKPEAQAALEKYHAQGQCLDVVVELTTY